jgi:hypothetical protein
MTRRNMAPMGLAASLAVLSLLALDGGAAAKTPSVVGAAAAQREQVCLWKGGQWVIDQHAMSDWLDSANSLRIVLTPDSAPPFGRYDPLKVLNVPESVFEKGIDANTIARVSGTEAGRFLRDYRALGESAPPTQDEQIAVLQKISGVLFSIDEIILRGQNSAIPFYGATPGIDANQWLSGTGDLVCNVRTKQKALDADKAAGPNFWDNVRVRGTPDSLLIGRNQKTAFAGADKASISFSYDGTKKTQTDVVQGTIGYALALGSQNDEVVLYGALNRNVSDTKGAPLKLNTNYYDLGAVFKFVNVVGSDNDPWLNVFSGRPHFLVNEIDHSRQVGITFVDKPIVNSIGLNFNLTKFDDDTDKRDYLFSLLFDLRGDANFYTDRGTTPATNLDYLRIGTKFGAVASINSLNSDISVTDTWMYGPVGSLRQLNDFQASWTYNFDPETKYFGLSLSYKIGRIEATGQPEQGWMIALTGKY